MLIERLDELMAEAKPIPFTREARVDRDEVYKILDRLRTTLPVEFERVRWMGRESEQEQGVESTLRQVTEAVTELRHAQRAQTERPSGPPLTVAAAEQVREVIEAAERTAAGVEREANAEAKRLREEAENHLRWARQEAERHLREAREGAAKEAADYLRRVEDATQKMLERANSAGSEIDGILANLRGSGGSVIEDLEAIMAGLTEIEVRRGEKAAAAARPGRSPVGDQPEGVADPPEAPSTRVARRPAGPRRTVVRPAGQQPPQGTPAAAPSRPAPPPRNPAPAPFAQPAPPRPAPAQPPQNAGPAAAAPEQVRRSEPESRAEQPPSPPGPPAA